MTEDRRTWRTVDGVRIEGTWRQVFVDNGGTHFLTDLFVYADGRIDLSSHHLDLDGLAAKLESGFVSVAPPEGGKASAHALAVWRFTDPHGLVTAEGLLGEVADEIERLNGRPESHDRCRSAAHAWAADPSEENRLALREAYYAVPAHRRRVLGNRHWNHLAAFTPVGEEAEIDGLTSVVTDEHRERARRSFTDEAAAIAGRVEAEPADGPATPVHPPTGTGDASIWALQIDHPAPVHYAGRVYASVAHAYWALSTSDQEAHDRIAAAGDGHEAHRLARDAPLREGWADARLAVMAALLRAKFAAHPGIAGVLRNTGDARIVHHGLEGEYWTSAGTNWIGRLLELIRAELRLAEGLP